MALPEGTKIQILAPVIRGQKRRARKKYLKMQEKADMCVYKADGVTI